MRQHSSRPKKKPFRRPFQHKFKQPPENIPARIHAILAREAPKAVVFRRGPSGQVCTLGWDMETDTFTMGQWLKGRIYEYRSDLSPDGELLVYFAADFRRADTIRAYTEELRAGKFGPAPAAQQALDRGLRGDVQDAFDEILERSPEAVMDELRAYEGQMKDIRLAEKEKLEEFARSDKAGAPSWTAVSRAPYLKALDLWFNGTAWNGGGLFTGHNCLWLNSPSPDMALQLQARDDLPLQVAEQSPFQQDFCDECPGVYCHRLIRDGCVEKNADGAVHRIRETPRVRLGAAEALRERTPRERIRVLLGAPSHRASGATPEGRRLRLALGGLRCSAEPHRVRQERRTVRAGRGG